MNLQLSLKTKWFEMTKAGVKPEDYREITPYWCARFILVDGKAMLQKWWIKWFEHQEIFAKVGVIATDFYLSRIVASTTIGCNYEFKQFTTNTMTLGYPKSTDTERIIRFEHRGIEIGYGNPEWGAEPNKLYFIVKHGNQL